MVKHPLEQKITESRNHGGRTIYAVLCILFLVNLSFSQYGTKNLEIAYRTITRGSYQLLELNEDFIIFTKKSAGKTVDTLKMDGKKWKAIAETVETLKLKEFPYLVAPSDRRKYDGAAHAKLKIYFKGRLYESAGFDDGNPPETIKELVEMVTELRPD